jgi:hypothetical protein
MPRRIRISEARAKLPQLAQYLHRRPTEVVLIEHRDLEERLALTTESHIRLLRTMVKELKAAGGRPFKLAGSMTTDLSDEDLEAALRSDRRRQERRSERKLRKMRS